MTRQKVLLLTEDQLADIHDENRIPDNAGKLVLVFLGALVLLGFVAGVVVKGWLG